MPKIVMSYRRDDSQAATHYLFERLRQHFGREAVFLDFDSIPYGVDFRDHITSVLHKCDVMLAMIGPRWQTGGGERNRLAEDNDWVRYEIEQAFANKIWLVPVLLDGAAMPRADQLPESIKKLAYLNAILVDTGRSFDTDTATLLQALESGIPGATVSNADKAVPEQRPAPVVLKDNQDNADRGGSPVLPATRPSPISLLRDRHRAAWIAAAALVLGGALGLYFLLGRPTQSASPNAGQTLAQIGQIPGTSQFRTAEEVAASDDADKAVSLASAEAATADKTRQDAVRAFQDSDASAQQGVNLELEWPWSDTDKTLTVVRYQGDVARGSGGTSAALPSGLGVATWDTRGHECVQGVDGATPGEYFDGQFAQGRINGVGIWRHCDGSSAFGHFTDNHVDGYVVLMTLDGAVFRGRRGSQGAIGVKQYKQGGNFAQYAGQWNMAGAFNGSGVLTCADGSQWKGAWSNNALTFAGLGYDSHGRLLARKDFSKGSAPLTALCR